jgi:hypothetical protein
MVRMLMIAINLAWILILTGIVSNVFGGVVGTGVFGVLLKLGVEMLPGGDIYRWRTLNNPKLVREF